MSASGRVVACVLLFLLIDDANCEDASIMARMKTLKDNLFKDYDRFVRPLNDTGNSTHVKFSMYPRYIIDLDEEKSLFTMDSLFFMHWIDPRLSWNKTFDIPYLQFPINMIWKPDISLYNSHSALVDPYNEVMAVITDSGEVYWVPPATTETFCAAPEGNEVTCEVVLGSWTHDGWEMNIDIYHNKVSLHDFWNDNPRWKVKEDEITLNRDIHKYECCDEPYYSLRVTFPMVRRPSPQLKTVRTPCILVAALLLALLWVPPQEAFVRVLMGAVLFLVLVLLLVYSATTAKTPHVARDAVVLVRSMTIVVSVVFVLQVVTMRLSRCPGPSLPSPTLVRWLSGPLSQRACLWSRTSSGDRVQLKEEEETEPPPVDEWGLVAAAVDRLVFVVCVPTLAVLLLVD